MGGLGRFELVGDAAEGAFEARAGAEVLFTGRVSDGGWAVRYGDADLRLHDDVGGELRLYRTGTRREEVAATTGPASAAGALAGCYLLMRDGRLFVTELCGIDPVRVELRHWRAPAAYVIATRGGGGWAVERTAAGASAPRMEAALVLFCALLIGSV